MPEIVEAYQAVAKPMAAKPRTKPPARRKINHHFIAPKRKGLQNLVRDNSTAALDVLERNLAKRKGLSNS